MTTPNRQLQALAPYLHRTHLDILAPDYLDHHARRAENHMNRALEQRRWNLARCYRDVVRATREELDRRATALDQDHGDPRKAR